MSKLKNVSSSEPIFPILCYYYFKMVSMCRMCYVSKWSSNPASMDLSHKMIGQWQRSSIIHIHRSWVGNKNEWNWPMLGVGSDRNCGVWRWKCQQGSSYLVLVDGWLCGNVCLVWPDLPNFKLIIWKCIIFTLGILEMYFSPPVLLIYNRHTAMYKFKGYGPMIWLSYIVKLLP